MYTMLPGHVPPKKNMFTSAREATECSQQVHSGRTFEWQDIIISACPKTGGSPFGFVGLAQQSGGFLN